MTEAAAAAADIKTTPLNAAHRALGARMVPFAGYDMPVQYEGVLAEHRWTREHAGLFDVSHMGQARLRGDNPFKSFEKLVPGDYQGLAKGKQRYSLLLAEDGGVLDDLMAGRPDDDGLFIVVNAACKDADFDLIERELAGEARLERLDRALLAIQGPEAAEVMAKHAPVLAELGFMSCMALDTLGVHAFVSRSGYTGEDGYELSVPADAAERIWNTLLEDARVKPIGLGARDSLRLEAGLPLYGHDVDDAVTPIEADLGFAVSKSRKEARDFKGAARIMEQIEKGPQRKRVGLKVTGAPAREGAEIADANGWIVGVVTSGGPSPSLGVNIAMGYVPAKYAELGAALNVIVRNKPYAAEVVAMPFVPKRFYRKP